jgi:hypothetical protein
MNLNEITFDIAEVLVAIDSSSPPSKLFHRGVGPYGEPQLLAEIARRLNEIPKYRGAVITKRTPDPYYSGGEWLLEFKIARPFGDNGKQAENWSVNLLHPYPGNSSTIGGCLKLMSLPSKEKKAVIVIGYEHDPPQIDLSPLMNAFEVVATQVAEIRLGKRVEILRQQLVHPVHQRLRVFAWEVLCMTGDTRIPHA